MIFVYDSMCVCATDGSVDFMTHYRLVNPTNLEGYARAFVVEDQDLDTVINLAVSQHGPFVHSFSALSPRVKRAKARLGSFLLIPVTAGQEIESEAGVSLTDPGHRGSRDRERSSGHSY